MSEPLFSILQVPVLQIMDSHYQLSERTRSDAFRIRRVEGVPAKSPSFWIKGIHITLQFAQWCGTALEAAQRLGRQWIGIDVSPTACRVIAKRLRDECKLRENEDLWKTGRGFIVRDLPWNVEQLRKIPHFEFENWAVIAVGGVPNKAQVGDMGIDGRIYPISGLPQSFLLLT